MFGTPIVYWKSGLVGLLIILTSCSRKPTLPLDSEFVMRPDEHRLLMAQIVDHRLLPNECAILEGRAYKYLLKHCAATKESRLKKEENKDEATAPTYQRLLRQPDLFRGKVVVVRRCVIIEVDKAELPPSFGLPGYSIMPALMVNQLHELYELRILSPPGSDLYEKLRRGILEGKNPVLRVSGYFMKDHCKLTDVEGEPPWRAPLLICPEPSIEKRAGTYDAYRDLVDAKMDRYLPSRAIKAPRAEERLVVEVLRAPTGVGLPAEEYVLRAMGRQGSPRDPQFLPSVLERFKARLPEDQRQTASAVVVWGLDAPRAGVGPTLKALKDLGVKRLCVKDENEVLQPDPEAPARPE